MTRQTKLASALRREHVTPELLFARAREKWLAGERIDVGRLAAELGISRATAFRWVGSRDALMGEILWSFYQPTLERALAETPERGAERIASLTAKAMRAILASRPVRRWLEQETEYALRLVTSETGAVQQNTSRFLKEVIAREVAEGHLRSVLDEDTLNVLVMRISTSFLYSDLTCGREPSVESAYTAIRILAGAQRSEPPGPAGAA